MFPLMEISGTTFLIRNFPEVSAGRYKFVTYVGKYGNRYKPWP
jgi:hypothetical protein